jgi:hypothetical protein
MLTGIISKTKTYPNKIIILIFEPKSIYKGGKQIINVLFGVLTLFLRGYKNYL